MKEYCVFYTETWDGHEGTAMYMAKSEDEVRSLFQSDFGNTAGIDEVVPVYDKEKGRHCG